MKQESSPLLINKDKGIWTLTINRPKKMNALTPEVLEKLFTALEAAGDNADTCAVVLRGAGEKAFCSGFDISHLNPAGEKGDPMEDMVQAIRNCAVPVIAMIHGYCIGGGCGLALACDIRLADTNARLGITAAKMGVVYPPSALRSLMDAVGVPAAKDLLFTARLVDAEEAARIGLVHRVVPPEQLPAVTLEIALGIASNSGRSVRGIKQLIHRLQESRAVADQYFAELQRRGTTALDLAEGKNAFFEKRPPDFKTS
jgi:enoyl-CoA hydratase/carnithine racemase